ncbi:RHS repeat protein [Chitinophaga silvisoli]|nr:RHS repeat-associated core domain-containing protein [Chitinophaga silvisoli]
MKKNQLFENYMNVRLGFNKHYWEYMDFRTNQCHISDTTGGGGTIISRVSYVSEPVADTILLCGKSATIFTTVRDTINNCSDSAFLVYSKGYDLYNNYKDVLKNNFDKIYRDTAIAGGLRELFTLGYGTSEYQYTLYYYDQAGNLTRTIPPAGVVIDRSATWKANLAAARRVGTRFVPAHQMATEYRYNTLNQIISKKTPDDSITNYWYDKLGRLVVSQNVKQSLAKNYSYTNFDALGRPIEVGELTSATAMTSTISRSEQSLASWLNAAAATRSQITAITYDTAYTSVEKLFLTQENLRGRISWNGYYNNASDKDNRQFTTATFYTYGIHGNIDTLLQDYRVGAMSLNNNRFKKITYQHDLISNKINFIAYQPGQKDAFYHRYSYDAENRLTNVETSHDSIFWENDAYYEYYKDGSLARMVIGQQQVQGIDYAYTLQGWLKGVNSTVLTPLFDIGGDGASGGFVARDAYGFGIHYFGARDYSPISTSAKPFAAAIGNNSLFNGNISAISQNISTIGTPLEYTYSYDFLNRLTSMTANKGLDSLSNSWTNTFSALADFKETISYDANGNIQSYNRNGNKTFAGAPLGMDSLTYHYRRGTNKLSYVTDLVRGTNYGNDIDNQVSGNYKYDSSGNMVSDYGAGVDSIKWNVYGKISKIYKHDSTVISYTYDVSGNRISKTVDANQTWYVRDAVGNILSTYIYGDTSVNKGQLSQIEINLYGSGRLGITTLTTNVQDTLPPPATSMTGLGFGKNITFTRGKKSFELTNHLGNVLATVSDRKIGISLNNSFIDYYNPVVTSAQEYYPFGMLIPGRGGPIGTGKNVAGSTVVVHGDTIPATLTVTQRTNNLPSAYLATQSVTFDEEFTSGSADEFTTLLVDQSNTDPGTENGVSYGITSNGYRYGFNGKENDNELKGEGNVLAFEARIYDSRTGRFFTIDPLTQKYPGLSPYLFANNSPILNMDALGLEAEPGGPGGPGPGLSTSVIPEVETMAGEGMYINSQRGVGRLGNGYRPMGYKLGTLPQGGLDAPQRFITPAELDNLIPPRAGFSMNADGTSGTVIGVNGNTWQISLLTNEKAKETWTFGKPWWGKIAKRTDDLNEFGKDAGSGVEYFYRAMGWTEFKATGGYIQSRLYKGDIPFITSDLKYLTYANSFIFKGGEAYQYDIIVRYTVPKGTKAYLESVSIPALDNNGNNVTERARRANLPIMKAEKYSWPTSTGIGYFLNDNFGFPGNAGSVHFNGRIMAIDYIYKSTPGLYKAKKK